MADDNRDVADAFAAIGNEHRVAILQALMDAYQDDETPISYSRLMGRTGLGDSGQFNYHLQQLLGRFVSEGEDGYALSYAGRTVVSAIESGALGESTGLDPDPVEGACYACGDEALVLRYPGERVRITCDSCGEEVVHTHFPPAGVADRSPAALKQAFDRWLRSWDALAAAGICPECSGRLVGELGRTAGTPADGDVAVRAVLSCEQCWVRGFRPVGLLVLEHPAVVSFFWQRGIDIRERPLWQFDWALSADEQTVVSEDPLQVRVEIAAADATLSLVVDESLSIESIQERREG